MILVVGVTASAVALQCFAVDPFPVSVFIISSVLVLLAMTAHNLQKRAWLKQCVLVWGLTGAAIACLVLIPDPSAPLFGLLVAFMAAFLIPWSEFLVAALLAIVVWWSAQAQGGDANPVGLFVALAAGAVISRLAAYTLYTAIAWAYSMEQRADQMLELARDRQGELNRLLMSLDRANTLLRRTQAELIAARQRAEEAQMMKEQFAANISHELRTPLNLILGFSEMMYLSPDVYGRMEWPADLRHAVHQIYQNSRHLLQMVDDILDLSRFEIAGYTLNKEATPLSLLLTQTADMVKGLFEGNRVRFDVSIPQDLPTLNVDRTRIRQVLINLLTNAQRFTERGTVKLAAKQTASEVVISVTDSGSGISEDKLQRIFEEFYQVDGSLRRKHGGAGLGLAISKRFIEAHHGRIWAESQLGRGSTFYVSLPLPGTHEMPIAPRQAEPPSPEYALNSQVLVVDPDPAITSLVRRYLEGYDVLQVKDPQHILDDVLLHHPRAVVYNRSPDNDHYQPDLGSLPVPVIECSLPSQAWVAQHTSVKGCLTKPITVEQILQEIEAVGKVQNILVVDDQRAFCQLMQAMLAATGRGFKVRHAYDGKEALRKMRVQPPDLVFLDLVMPEMDGFQLLGVMRREQRLAGIPVVLVTATSYVEDVARQFSHQVAIRRAGGLRPAEVLSALRALIDIVKPLYDERAVPSEAMISPFGG